MNILHKLVGHNLYAYFDSIKQEVVLTFHANQPKSDQTIRIDPPDWQDIKRYFEELGGDFS